MGDDTNRVRTPRELPPVKKLDEKVINKTGFESIDLLEAPAKPPELQNVRPRPSTLQYTTLATGLVLIAIGLFTWALLSSAYVGIALLVIGALCIALAVMVRL